MAWWDFLRSFLYHSILKQPGEQEEGDDEITARVAIRHRALDWLYFGLGLFTHVYGFTTAALFFARASITWPTLVGFLDALQEPYLGALGVYVVLKEIEKRRHHLPGRHYGEFFTAAWAALLIVSSILVFFSPRYHFDEVYQIIITNSLATFIIYLGGMINRP